jgi:hypothetical protein
MFKEILQLILIGSHIFKEERQRYYNKKIDILYRTISDVEDSTFYNKDMEAKGKAQRDLAMKVEELRKEFIREAAQ